MTPSFDEGRIRQLLEHGNAHLAERLVVERMRLVERDGQEVDRLLRLKDEIAAWRMEPKGVVLAPLPNSDDTDPGLCVRIDLEEPGAPVECFEPSAREAVDTALKDAWAIVRGTGERPRAGIEFPFEWRVKAVEGSSLYLPVLIAGVAHWGGERPRRNVFATGSFDHDLDLIDAKLDLFELVKQRIHVDELLAGTRRLGGNAESWRARGLRLVGNTDEAVNRVFDVRPWHASAEVSRIQVYCGHRKDPPTRSAASWTSQPLPYPLCQGDLRGARDVVLERLGACRACELSIGGPVLLAAYLGCVFRNHPADIRLIHRDGLVYWDNRKLESALVPQGDGAPAWVLVRSKTESPEGEPRRVDGQQVPPLWEVISVPFPLHPRLMREAVAEVKHRLEAKQTPLHVAIDGPMPLAWAVGQLLQPLAGEVVFFHKRNEDGVYERWFSAADARI